MFLVTGKDYVLVNGFAIFTLILALLAFVTSALLGIVIQSHAFAYKTVSQASLLQLTDDAFWGRSADYAARCDVSQQVKTIATMREANQRTAKLVTASLVFQVAAVVLLTMSIGLELCSRMSLFADLSEWYPDFPFPFWF
jgi:hypothetical protein